MMQWQWRKGNDVYITGSNTHAVVTGRFIRSFKFYAAVYLTCIFVFDFRNETAVYPDARTSNSAKYTTISTSLTLTPVMLLKIEVRIRTGACLAEWPSLFVAHFSYMIGTFCGYLFKRVQVVDSYKTGS